MLTMPKLSLKLQKRQATFHSVGFSGSTPPEKRINAWKEDKVVAAQQNRAKRD